ncbi:MAG: hypothetical protein LBT74_07775 [Acidobacteriota bacterium]|jgi:hypothetical protein|nr:hypothetical protein [Acidobacteriota bacterium]
MPGLEKHPSPSPRTPLRLLLPLCVASLLAVTAVPAGISSGLPAGDACAGVEGIWWHFEGQRRTRDGGVEATFALRGADGLDVEDLEAYYTADPIRYGPAADHAVQPEDRRKAYRMAVGPGTRRLTVYSGSYVQLELWAVARVRGDGAGGGCRRFVTQTALNLYGESGREAAGVEELSAPPALPGFDLNRRRGFYAAQTGEPISFSMRGGAAPPSAPPVRVLLDGAQVAELLPRAGVYDYVLPRDRRLGGRALLDHRDLLLVPAWADGADGVRFTCCLPLYRSMRDNLHFPLGLGVLGAAFALGLGAVLLKGRRFPWR